MSTEPGPDQSREGERASTPRWYPRRLSDVAWMDGLFWILLGVAFTLLVYPIWIGPIVPTWDFGGHLAIADVWTRLEEVELYREVYERRTGLVPNTVAARFTSWLYPVVDTLTGMRIFLTLTMVGTIAALGATLRVFDRSRWLLFGCLPILWNGAFHWGMVNYVAAYPLFFGAVALARRTGQTADWRWGVPLGVVCTASFFVHGLGCPLTVASATLVLLCSIRRLQSLAWLGVFAPPTALWFHWRSGLSGAGVPSGGLFEILESAVYYGPYPAMKRLLAHTMDPTSTSNLDLWLLFALFGIWLIWMGVSESAPKGDAEVVHGDGFASRVLARGKGLYRQVDRHALLVLAVVLWAGFVLSPEFIGDTNVKARFVPLFVWTAVLLPRLPRRNLPAIVATGAAVVLSCAYGLHLQQMVRKIHRLEFEPLVELVDRIPEQKRVDCLKTLPEGASVWKGAVFRGRPLQHNCPGLVYARRSGFGWFGFPKTAYNAIKFRDSGNHPNIRYGGLDEVGTVQAWDYLLIRGERGRPPEYLATEVARSGGERTPYERRSSVWRLYRVMDPEIPATHRETAGGEGGSPFEWACGEGEALSGLGGKLTRNETLGTLQPLCRRVVVSSPRGSDGEGRDAVPSHESEGADSPPEQDTGEGVLRLEAPTSDGPRIGRRGTPGSSFRAECPEGEFLVGFEGRSGRLVDRVEILCAPLEQGSEGNLVWDRERVESAGGGGGDGGEPFRFTCPTDSVATALIGRHGIKIDAVGLACVSTGDLSPAVESGEDEGGDAAK